MNKVKGHDGRRRVSVSEHERIRKRRADGETFSGIAKSYGCSQATIYAIIVGRIRKGIMHKTSSEEDEKPAPCLLCEVWNKILYPMTEDDYAESDTVSFS